jgi:hypothetical protein
VIRRFSLVGARQIKSDDMRIMGRLSLRTRRLTHEALLLASVQRRMVLPLCSGWTPVGAANLERFGLTIGRDFSLLKSLERTSIATQTERPLLVNTTPQTIFRVAGISIAILCLLIAPGLNSAPSKGGCPLSPDYGLNSPTSTTSSSSGTTTASSDTSTQSPEKSPGPLKALCHKPGSPPNNILCLPPSAYNAHIQHGDTPLPNYVCTKEGNQGPCN